MSIDTDKAFVETVRQQLERHAGTLDDVTTARLAAARKGALGRRSRSVRHWLPLTGLAAAAAVLLAVLLVHQAPAPDRGWDPLLAQDDIDLIEELDFYAWLEETQSNS
jgi:type VI protein secretion system component VasF